MKLFLAFIVSALLLLSVGGPLIGLIVAGNALEQIEATGIADAVEDARRDLRRLYQTLDSEEAYGLTEEVGNDLDRAAAGTGRLLVVGRLVRESLSTTLIATAIISIAIAVAVVAVTRRSITGPIGRASAFLSTYPQTRGRLETPTAAAVEIRTLATRANEMLERIEEQNRRIKLAERENLGRFVVHQLKNGLTPIGLAVREIRRNPGVAGEQALRLIEGQSQRVERLVEQFRTVYRAPTPFKETREVATLLTEIRAVLAAEFPELEISEPATVFNTPTAPAATLPPTIACDVDLVTESFRNLAANSRDAGATMFCFGAAFDGPIAGAIVGDSKLSGAFGAVTLWAGDDGPGVPAGLETTVFEDEVTTKSQGMGLGLAFVARVVEAHGWSVCMLPGPGARVEIVIDGTSQT